MSFSFMSLINDNVDVLRYTIADSYPYRHCITGKSSEPTNVNKAFQETLHKLLSAGATDGDIEFYTGFTKRIYNPDNYMDIDLGYVLNGSLSHIETLKKDFHWFKKGDFVRIKSLEELLEVYKDEPRICKKIKVKEEFQRNNEGFAEEMYSYLGKVYQIADIEEDILYQKCYLDGDLYGFYFNSKWLNKFSNDFEIIDRDRLEGLI